jgi:hypothetical protein
MILGIATYVGVEWIVCEGYGYYFVIEDCVDTTNLELHQPCS